MTLLFGLLIWAVMMLIVGVNAHIKDAIIFKKEAERLEYNKLKFELIKLKMQWERLKKKSQK